MGMKKLVWVPDTISVIIIRLCFWPMMHLYCHFGLVITLFTLSNEDNFADHKKIVSSYLPDDKNTSPKKTFFNKLSVTTFFLNHLSNKFFNFFYRSLSCSNSIKA